MQKQNKRKRIFEGWQSVRYRQKTQEIQLIIMKASIKILTFQFKALEWGVTELDMHPPHYGSIDFMMDPASSVQREYDAFWHSLRFEKLMKGGVRNAQSANKLFNRSLKKTRFVLGPIARGNSRSYFYPRYAFWQVWFHRFMLQNYPLFTQGWESVLPLEPIMFPSVFFGGIEYFLVKVKIIKDLV